MSTSRLRSVFRDRLQLMAQLVEPDPVGAKLGLLLVELLLDDRLAVAQHRDLADQMVDLVAVLLDRGREDALAVMDVLEPVALLLEL